MTGVRRSAASVERGGARRPAVPAEPHERSGKTTQPASTQPGPAKPSGADKETVAPRAATTPPKAVLFDLDGTLLNTLEDLADSVNEVLEEQGLPAHPVDAYRYFVGDGAATLIHRVLPEAVRSAGLESRCLARFREIYATRWNVKTVPYDGIPTLLAALADRGMKLAVLSNKPHDATEQCVGEMLKGTRFDEVQGQTPEIAKKPDPAGALAIARRLGVSPREVLYVGDTATDMQTAVRAGMVPIGVLWGFRTAEELVEHGARTLIAHPAELLALLDDREIAR